MINYHPDRSTLTQHASGQLLDAKSLIVASHIAMCRHCQNELARLELQQAELELMAPASAGPDFSAMCAQILNSAPPSQPGAALAKQPGIATSLATQLLELNGKKYPLPAPLIRLAQQSAAWRGLPGKLWQRQLNLGKGIKASFIFMEPGGKVPEHTHLGQEYTLVLDGEFSDELGRYRTGDLMLNQQQQLHTPFADHPDGCLVFTVVDAPLHFTSGFARLINPFSKLFF